MKNLRPRTSQRRVAVCASLRHGSERDFLMGIFRHLDDGYAWKIDLIQESPPFTADSLALAEHNGLDGIIISDAHEEDIIPELVQTKTPIALISGTAFRKSHPMFNRTNPTVVLHNDNFGIARMGLSHFAECGKFMSRGFIPEKRGVVWSDERLVAFADAVAASGEDIRVFRDKEQTLEKWLLALPKPTAVMAAYDELAVKALDACGRVGLTVPRQVSVLGVDNDLLLCQHSTPPLSSILPDHEGMGYNAATELERLMSAPRKPKIPQHFTLPPLKVVCRESTGPLVPSATLIERAKALVLSGAVNGTSIADIVKRLGVSRRLLELRFREAEGKTLCQALAQRRLEVARKLIQSTSRKISRIAEECGFSDAKHLSHAFKATFGQSPRDFRKNRNRAGVGEGLTPLVE